DGYVAASDRKLNRIEIVIGAGFGIVHAALLAGGLVAVGLLMQAGSIGAPVAALGMLIILGAMEPFSALRRGAMELGRTILAAKRVVPQLQENAKPATPRKPENGTAVHLKNVSVRHDGADRDALNNLDLDIAAGERIAIVGTSGAGKSTLFNLLAGEIPANQGSVAVVSARL